MYQTLILVVLTAPQVGGGAPGPAPDILPDDPIEFVRDWVVGGLVYSIIRDLPGVLEVLLEFIESVLADPLGHAEGFRDGVVGTVCGDLSVTECAAGRVESLKGVADPHCRLILSDNICAVLAGT